jgi:hypothetical protein
MAQHNANAIDPHFTQAFGEEADCDRVHFAESVRAKPAAYLVRQRQHQCKEYR